MQTHLQQFLKYLHQDKGRAAQTIANYDFYLSRFLKWAKISDPKKIDAQLLKNYQLHLARQTDRFGQPLALSTQNYHLIALRSFLRYLKAQKKSAVNFSDLKLNRVVSHAAPALTPAELNALLAAPLKAKADPTIRLRDKTLLEILFSTGLKVSSLSNLKKNNIDWENGQLIFDATKIKYKLTNQGRYYLKQYLAKRRDRSPYLFVREDKAKGLKPPTHLTPRSIQRLIKNYASHGGIETQVTPQIIRQTVLNQRLSAK